MERDQKMIMEKLRNDDYRHVVRDFDALVAACAGTSRKLQEDYLVRLIMKLMIKRYGRDPKLPDANVLRRHGIGDIKNVQEAMRVLDAYYLAIARSILDDAEDDSYGLRFNIVEYMVEELNQKSVDRNW